MWVNFMKKYQNLDISKSGKSQNKVEVTGNLDKISAKIELWLGGKEALKNLAQKNWRLTWWSKTMFLDGCVDEWVGG